MKFFKNIGQKIRSFGRGLGEKIYSGSKYIGQKVYDNRYKIGGAALGLAAAAATTFGGVKAYQANKMPSSSLVQLGYGDSDFSTAMPVHTRKNYRLVPASMFPSVPNDLPGMEDM